MTKVNDPENELTGAAEGGTKFDLVWVLGCVLITAVATLLRFLWLGMKPFHHDEGVNAYFLTNLFRDGIYKYDPANYHGPTLYYIAIAFAKVFGLETLPLRWSVAIWGVLTVVLAFYLRRYIGRIGSLAAALFLALSPGMVYISRYFIHEIFFIFLSLALVLSIVLFIEREKAGLLAIAWTVLLLMVCFLPSTLSLASYLTDDSFNALWAVRAGFFIAEAVLVFFVIRMLLVWNDGRPIYFLLASACVALLFATKETAFITLGTMLIACVCVRIWRKVYRNRGAESAEDEISDEFLNWQSFRNALGTGTDRLLILIAAAAVFIYISVLFFSSFFTYPQGVKGAIEAYTIWTKTGSKDHTQNGYLAYLKWAWETEAPILILSALGSIIAFAKARHRFAMFAALWAFGLFLAYTIIPYKTPWLALSFLLPMCIIAGYGINELATARDVKAKIAAAVLAVAGTSVLTYQTWDHNFVRPADEDTVYAYAHTNTEFLTMVAEIERYAEKSGVGHNAVIDIVTPDYWPLVWYLKDFPHANFHGRLVDTKDAEIIVAKKNDQDAEVIRRYSANYRFAGQYDLRSGVELMLLVRKDFADPDDTEVYRIRGQ